MAKTLKMSYEDGELIKKNFYKAKDDLEENEKGFPKSVDAGDGTEYIVAMINKIAEDAGDIAVAADLGGDKMANAMDKVKGVDESVAQTFRDLRKKMS